MIGNCTYLLRNTRPAHTVYIYKGWPKKSSPRSNMAYLVHIIAINKENTNKIRNFENRILATHSPMQRHLSVQEIITLVIRPPQCAFTFRPTLLTNFEN